MMRARIIFSNSQELEVDVGTKLQDVIALAGIKMDFPCGGRAKCGQCKVVIKYLKGNKTDEVLACSYLVKEDIWLEIPSQENNSAPILETGRRSELFVESGVRKHYDRGRTLVELEGQLIQIEAGDTTDKCYGLAVDVGTTTVVGYLMDLNSGEQVGVSSSLNGQRAFGADVISRINAVNQNEDNLAVLQAKVIETINDIIKEVTSKNRVSVQDIYMATLAGNTCMHHLLLGLNPRSLGQAPFLPVIQQMVNVSSQSLNLALNPQAKVWVFPVIAGFVGGDTVGAILASNLQEKQGISLLVDIGTNGEIVINAKGRMVACSAAAGPALEGAQVTFGMRADKGAINKVVLKPSMDIEVIGSGPAKGIAGSGLIDLLGELIKAKLINKRGKLTKPENYEGPGYLRGRLAESPTGMKFVLLTEEENQGQEIYLTQGDISQLQLAKGALHAAMELLVKTVGATGDQVEEVLLAGAFGNFMNAEQALTIGLLPEWAGGKIKPIGNAAGEGAKIGLLSVERRKEAQVISERVEFLELAGTANFQGAFIEGMLFHRAT